jgi:acyl-CoA synthetase (AMP-forming)/AMP-acid ligase II
METVIELLSRADAQGVALAAPGRKPLRYGELRDQIESTVAQLNRLGVGREDAVAIVLPNGPEMAAAFLAVAAGATAAPLNPAYRAEEFEFYLRDLQAELLIVPEAVESPVLGVAERLGVAAVGLRSDPSGAAGRFELRGTGTGRAAARPGLAQAEDTALVLHTSGTTSRPKIVPLSHANLTSSAAHIAETLRLAPDDGCLNVMPLFHIHGLVAAVLSSLGVGASVHCTPGFNALRFSSWLEEARPSWYTAVPTMHQAILSRVRRSAEPRARLRFVRSSSASLAPQLMAELEQVFGAPVIEAYGMTEAAHQMASNPLPPGTRKAGSVGPAAGPRISIMDEHGKPLPAGEPGEVAICGPNVIRGYRNNPQANASAFTDGWFRTGDQGVLDEQGYLRLTGRLKEIINRGGEKISPREVDEVLLDHPAVAQVVTFAMPHDKLGEEVAAAVVLNPGTSASEAELRAFVSARLADFKVPRKLLFLEEIPKGPTGKLQRIGLAQRLGLG